MPHRQNTVHVTYRLLERRRTGPPRAAPVAALPAARSAGRTPRPAEPTPSRPCDDRYEICAADRTCPPLRLLLHGTAARFTLDAADVATSPTGSRRAAATSQRARCGARATSASSSTRTASRSTLVASTESWETIVALTPDGRGGAETERRRRLARPALRPRADGFAARAGARGRPVHHHAGRPRRGRRAGARRRRRGPHRHRRLSLVHRLGPRHDDQPRGADAVHRPAPRGRLHPAHLRALRARRPDPQHVPRRRARRALSHRRRDALVLPRARPLPATPPATATTLRHAAPEARRHRRAPPRAARASASASIRRTACCARAPRAISSPGWTRRSTTGWSRRGAARRSRSTRSGTTRCGCSKRWLRELGGDDAAPDLARARRARARESFNQRFWYEAGGYLYDVVDGEQGDDPACRPNQVFAISLDHPVLDRARWEPVLDVVRERLLTPVGLRSLAPGIPTTSRVLRRPPRARRRLSPGHGLGLADRPVHRRLAQGPSRRPRGRAPLPRRLRRRTSSEACVGSISEIFDAEAPYTPRGCIAQAWSVAEVLRCWVKTAAPTRIQPTSAGRQPERQMVDEPHPHSR